MLRVASLIFTGSKLQYTGDNINLQFGVTCGRDEVTCRCSCVKIFLKYGFQSVYWEQLMVTALTLHVTIATPYILAVSNQSIVVLF